MKGWFIILGANRFKDSKADTFEPKHTPGYVCSHRFFYLFINDKQPSGASEKWLELGLVPSDRRNPRVRHLNSFLPKFGLIPYRWHPIEGVGNFRWFRCIFGPSIPAQLLRKPMSKRFEYISAKRAQFTVYDVVASVYRGQVFSRSFRWPYSYSATSKISQSKIWMYFCKNRA